MTTHTESLVFITRTEGQPADANVIWRQVDRWTWIGMGAKASGALDRGDGLQVPVSIGAGTRKRVVVIKLNRDDLYDVEIGHVRRGTADWTPEAQTLGVYAEDLDAELRRLYGGLAR